VARKPLAGTVAANVLEHGTGALNIEACRVLTDEPGNPSSIHAFGQRAKARLDDTRHAVAALIGAGAGELVLTGGGTDAINLALRGAAEATEPSGRRHLIASAIEHEAVLATFKKLCE
jgi:cysteine desulfurase